ncbi:MAG TPA: 5-oxoprolinase subunit PxpA [Thermoanaerobaculia bacterium]|nr:5-oxoprolinase subunit PxpA [Thermoanaerobaculia bacterium]
MIDLSADVAEGAPGENEIWPMINSANVACGGHIGDESSMTDAVKRARRFNVRLGAHPSYPDRENFGRKTMTMAPAALRTTLIRQIEALREIGQREGVPLVFVKPHGALYNDAHKDIVLAGVIVEAIREIDPNLALVCPNTSEMAAAARAAGTNVIREAFADRRYNADGSLVSRSISGSLLTVAEAADQAALLVRERIVIARDGSRIAVPFDTICIHADMDNAVERLHAIRKRLENMQ